MKTKKKSVPKFVQMTPEQIIAQACSTHGEIAEMLYEASKPEYGVSARGLPQCAVDFTWEVLGAHLKGLPPATIKKIEMAIRASWRDAAF